MDDKMQNSEKRIFDTTEKDRLKLSSKFGHFPSESVPQSSRFYHNDLWFHKRFEFPLEKDVTREKNDLLTIKNVYIRDTVAGVSAAIIYVVSTYPLSKVQFRQQLSGVCIRTSLKQIHEEGLRHLYRGLLPPLLQKSASRGIMFGSFDVYQDALGGKTFTTTILAGNLAGWTEGLLTPFERVQTIMQDRAHHDRFRNSFDAFSKIGSMSVKETYRGGSVIFIRNGLSNAMFFALKDPVSESFDISSRFIRSFLSGAILGALLSTIFYPCNVIKTRMQSKIGGEYMSIKSTVKTIYYERDRSISRFFIGYHLNYTRALLSWGIINAVYETLREILTDSSA